MFLLPTSDIRVETEGSDVRFDFPPRPLGKLRWLGLLLVAFSVLFVWMPAQSLFRFLENLAAGKGEAGNWVFVAFLIPFVIVGLFPMLLGLLAIGGRCRIEWRAQRLLVTDYVGPIRWRRRMPQGSIRKFTVKHGGVKVNDKPVTSGPLVNLGALMIEFEHGKPRFLVLGYPHDWLQALAEDLSIRVGATAVFVGNPAVELVDASTNEPQSLDVHEQPAGSRVQVEERGAGVSLQVPPAGLWRGSKGLFFFALLWCGFMVFFTANTASSVFKPGRIQWAFAAFIVGFWAIGIGLVTAAVRLGRRSATLEVDASRLRVETRGLFGMRQREWIRGDLTAIRADASGMEVNDHPLIELQIHPRSGKKVGLLAGRNEEELRWIATRLRRALNLPAR